MPLLPARAPGRASAGRAFPIALRLAAAVEPVAAAAPEPAE